MEKRKKVAFGAVILIFVLYFLLSVFFSGRGRGNAWATFKRGSVTYTVPDGWTCVDPFTTMTPYWSHLWTHDSPGHDTRIAFFQSPDGEVFQIMLWLGDSEELKDFINKHGGKYDDHVLVDEVLEETVTTADGTEVVLWTAEMAEGLLAGDPVTYVLGTAEVGGDTFILNAGGLTASYEADIVTELVRSLCLK